MCENEIESSVFKDHNEQSGIFLGFWNQEETPKLINDLEHSVNLIESKCKKLLQQLIYYRKYFRNLNASQNQNLFSVKRQKEKVYSKNCRTLSNSMPDISFRKNLYKLEEIRDQFKRNFESKLLDINTELKIASDKIGLHNTIFLFPTEDYQNELNIKAIKQMKKSLSNIKKEFIKSMSLKATTKSDCSINSHTNINNNDLEISKITKNELELYQKLSKLSMLKCHFLTRKKNTRKTISSPIRRKNIFMCRKYGNSAWKTSLKKPLSFFTKYHFKNKMEYYQKPLLKNKITKNELCMHKKKKLKTNMKKIIKYNKKKIIKMNTPFEEKNTFCKTVLNKSHSNNEIIFYSLIEALYKKYEPKDTNKIHNNTANQINDISSNSDKKIPFIAGTSTSKSFNIGMNVQQFLSLSKYAKQLRAKKTSFGTLLNKKPCNNNDLYKNNTKNAGDTYFQGKCFQEKNLVSGTKILVLNKNQNLSSNSDSFKKTASTCSCSPKQSKNIYSNQNEMECKENIWRSDQNSNFRKSRSKYTKSSPESFLEYHKSTSHYTNGEKAMIKSESKTTYTIGSKVMVSDCQRTDFFEINKQNFHSENASGDGFCKDGCTKLKMDWSKIYGTFLDLYRKYSSLKEQIKNNNLDFFETDLKLLQLEIDQALEEYKQFLNFYSTFLNLKCQLKSFKVSCECNSLAPVTSFFSDKCKNQYFFRSTSAMTMRKVLRHVQALQEKIRQID